MAEKNLSLTVLKKYLKTCSKEELIDDISELCQKFKPVKDFYQIRLSPQAELLVSNKYRKTIEDEFFPARGLGKARLAIAKKAITEFKKVSQTPDSLVDIMLFYVEQGVKFTNEYGDIDEPFYISMETMYEKTIELINQYKLHNIFQARFLKVVKDTSDIGWGFHDTLQDIYSGGFGID